MSDDKLLKILRDHWGYDSFRGIQHEIIDSIMAGRDTLGLMPTGGGKSITFQVPALAMSGVCVVITPLIALMKDQVMNLRKRGIQAAAIYSGMMRADIIQTLENVIFGGVKILYVSPERLASELFIKKLSHAKVSFITVDEAHCISQWGYDFRPSYLKIADIRAVKPDAPILALTATATPKVVCDIQRCLGFKDENVFKMSFERKNLAYKVKLCENKEAEITRLLHTNEGCAIIYVRSRERAKETATLLNASGISATFYHAGLETSVRDTRQKEWTEGKVRVIVATNAFGMGIDKPDVRLVIHTDCPDSIESYFQEAGRAGRDGLYSQAILLYNGNDGGKLERRINDNFPELDDIRDIYEHLAYFFQIGMGSGAGCTFEFNIDNFSKTYKYFPNRVEAALKILTRAGYINYREEEENKAQVMMLLGRNDLYRLDSLTAKENAVVTSLLRNYGGLFTQYVYIDESLIAADTGLTREQTYDHLKAMSQRRILQFIPRKKIPHLTYTQRREEPEHLIFPHEVYNDRKEEFRKRIKAMRAYATDTSVCRSRMLLHYFGEERATDCGQCDVCMSHKGNAATAKDIAKARSLILQLLSDGRMHHATELGSISSQPAAVEAAISRLADEETVIQADGYISLRATVKQ